MTPLTHCEFTERSRMVAEDLTSHQSFPPEILNCVAKAINTLSKEKREGSMHTQIPADPTTSMAKILLM